VIKEKGLAWKKVGKGEKVWRKGSVTRNEGKEEIYEKGQRKGEMGEMGIGKEENDEKG
jgi:hypothetical protein